MTRSDMYGLDPGSMRAMQIVTPPTPEATITPLMTASRRSPASSSRPSRATAARSLGHQLERDRLEQRAARVRRVIHALRERAAARDGGAGVGGVPRPLRAAIEDFGRELAELEHRLRHHPRHPHRGR
jgi:hypothetical protein